MIRSIDIPFSSAFRNALQTRSSVNERLESVIINEPWSDKSGSGATRQAASDGCVSRRGRHDFTCADSRCDKRGCKP